MDGSAAQAGFYYQNNVAALKIIQCLFFDTDISHIELENYEKGKHIDDVILHRTNSIEYYQVKWANDDDSVYSLYNLLKSDDQKKSLFKQLAEGYISVKGSDKSFSIILFTTKKESSQKRPSEGINHSLPELRKNIFEPIKQSSISLLNLPKYEEYKPTLEKIKSECNLDENDFLNFIKSLEFKFQQEPTEQLQQAIKSKLSKLGIEESLFEKLLNGVVNWSISGAKITKNTVLDHLGISDRFEDKLSHHFKIIDDKFYVQNNDFSEKLNDALSNLPGGYIFIEGLPGIGKSTALTKFKENHPDLTLTYYCYIPDAKNDFGELRHQSYYFHKSLCINIENNFPDVDLPNKYSDRYGEKLASYIETLGELNKKIIFIIDGLDHVYRDLEFQENSLLNQLKGNLPNGIFFLLSSQYKSVLSSSVSSKINTDPRRHITVSKFSRKEIEQYLSQKGISTPELTVQIEKTSGGIPLYLHYISEIILSTPKEDYENILEDFPTLDQGEINIYHEYLFQAVESDQFTKWILAILAYRKENSDVGIISKLLEIAEIPGSKIEISNVLKRYAHLLKQIDGRSYSIFHNSFREFILSKTTDLKEIFNQALVRYYEENPNTDEAFRNYFRHLNEIGEYQKIISATTLNRIKDAWANFRTIKEIEDNLDFALNACIEISSLAEFIRIAFLKAQIGVLNWNLENSNIDFPTLFLNMGLEQNSLRAIWDGDFVLVGKPYFAQYLERYLSKTSNLLPKNVIRQGLYNSNSRGKKFVEIVAIAKAEALTNNDITSIFSDINSIKWIGSDNDRRNYIKDNFSQEKNDETNFEIKTEVLDCLLKHKKSEHLLTLQKEFSDDKKLLTCIQIALVKLISPTEKRSAIQILEKIDFKTLIDQIYFDFIAYCTQFLTDQEILSIFGKREVEIPKLPTELIHKEDMDFIIHSQIVNLFKKLKPIRILQPEILNQLHLKISVLPYPIQDIYNSIFNLSELWYRNRNEDLSENEKIVFIKTSIEALFIQRNEPLRKTHTGLFDSPTDAYFIRKSIVNLFKPIFEIANKILSEKGIREVIDFWIKTDDSTSGLKHHNIALGIAKTIYSNKDFDTTSIVLKLIQKAESLARTEQETGTLIEHLGEIAPIYGLCGFPKDATRIYNQLFEISFGLNYKKDYQASDIITPLEKLNALDPENSLKRLSEVFTIQDRLGDVGTGRMHSFCLSKLMELTFKDYPELVFDLIEREEENISREDTLDQILELRIKKATAENLPLFYSIVKALSRWGNDNYFLSLSKTLLQRAGELNDDDLIKSLLEKVKHNVLVELEKPEILNKFSEILTQIGREPLDYGIQTFQPNEDGKSQVSTSKRPRPGRIKFNQSHSLPNIDDLIKLFEEDYELFKETVQLNFVICLKNNRNQTFRSEYHRSKRTFEKFFKSLPDEIQKTHSPTLLQVIRNFIQFKISVSNFHPEKNIETDKFQKFFDEFVEKTNALFPEDSFNKFIQNDFDSEEWTKSILEFINDRRHFVFRDLFPDEHIYQIVSEVSIFHIDNLLDFIKNKTFGSTNAVALLKISNRLIHLDPERAKRILTELSNNEDLSLLLPSRYESVKHDYDIIDSILKVDQNFGKKFLLKSYYSQRKRYSQNFADGIEKLLQYEQHFDGPNIAQAYYEANLQYNKELAAGLPAAKNNYDFIANHREQLNFEEIIIKYLVSLLNYPVFKIRGVTLESIFELVTEHPRYLKDVFKFGIKPGNDNQIEYCLVVFHAISLKAPELLLPFKKELWAITLLPHFNILESVKSVLLNLNAHKNDFLTKEEIKILNKITTESPFVIDRLIIPTGKSKKILYSGFQTQLLYQIHENDKDETEIIDDINIDLIRKGLASYSPDDEGRVHRRYNMNSNFDTIEIYSPYYDQVKSSLNRIFLDKIKRGSFDKRFIQKIKPQFRLIDPTLLLNRKQSKPSYINWLSDSESGFLDFKDLENIEDKLIGRETDYITLYETGSQRPQSDYSSDDHSTCYFEVIAFLKKKDVDLSILEQGQKTYAPYLQNENRFSNELPSPNISSISFPIKGIRPILEVSANNFRGAPRLSQAFLLSDVLKDLGLEKIKLSDALDAICVISVKAMYWQSAYTSGMGRRRHQPTSEGFILKIERELLVNFLRENDLTLCYQITQRRTSDKYKPESEMYWHSFQKTLEISL